MGDLIILPHIPFLTLLGGGKILSCAGIILEGLSYSKRYVFSRTRVTYMLFRDIDRSIAPRAMRCVIAIEGI